MVKGPSRVGSLGICWRGANINAPCLNGHVSWLLPQTLVNRAGICLISPAPVIPISGRSASRSIPAAAKFGAVVWRRRCGRTPAAQDRSRRGRNRLLRPASLTGDPARDRAERRSTVGVSIPEGRPDRKYSVPSANNTRSIGTTHPLPPAQDRHPTSAGVHVL